MARANVPLLSFNRGLISPKALARVDLDRTKLSAEVMTNWLPKSQGSMSLRPGTKYLGSSYNDTGAEFVEFVASTDDIALIELTHQKMRVWLGSNDSDLTLLSRPLVDTAVALTDTGWTNTSSGGAVAVSTTDVIPIMTGPTTGGVTITASSEVTSGQTEGDSSAWKAADDVLGRDWLDTGSAKPSTLPSWWNVDFGSDTGNRKSIRNYSIRCDDGTTELAPKAWELLTGNYDTGTYATDTGKWTLEDARSAQTGWALSENRTFKLPGTDTGTIELRRHWRLYFTQSNDATREMRVAEIEMYDAPAAQQVRLQGGKRVFNASSIGALARLEKRVVISDTGTEHALAITVERGPLTLRVGSSQRSDDLVSETVIGTGYHNLAFTPIGSFWVTLQSDLSVDRIVSSLEISDSGTVEITAPWSAANLSNIRYDQSADVVYVDCDGVAPKKIERRGTGRSWSVVDYAPKNGPFLSSPSSSAKLSVSHFFGNTTLNSDIPFFTADHVGALIRVFHEGQGGQWKLGAEDAKTDPIEVTGISDTGTATATSERRIIFAVSGTWSGRMIIERSFDGDDLGFKAISGNLATKASDTGTFTTTIDDPDDNVKVWYRARIGDTGASGFGYTSGVATVNVTYGGGGVTGFGRITGFNSNTSVAIEVLSRFSDTGSSANWQQGYWSAERGFPSAVALHGGRLAHAQGGSLFMSVSDDYENFDDETEGDASPLTKTLGSGPVDNIYYLIALLRLIIGTSGAEMAARSSSIDEPLTRDNASVRAFSTQGSANIRALKMDTDAVFVQRSGQRLFQIGFGQGIDALGDYQASELTTLVPDLLEDGVVSIAIQRQPDTRIHCVLGNGKVAILTYEPREEVLCWSMWETDGTVEKAMVLPGQNEDQVYYHVNRTINGATKRFLEQWAMESECRGDTGLTWLADCAVSYTDTGRATVITGLSHLNGESAIVCGDDTGQSFPFKDYSYDTGGVQKTWPVAAGSLTLTGGHSVHHAVVGLPYTADWKSTKLAYAAEAGTALAQMKRTDKIAFVLHRAHNAGLFFGNDTGNLDLLPRVTDAGVKVDSRKVFDTFDQVAIPFPGVWGTDTRIVLRAKAPRPMTVLAAVPTVATNEKV